MNPSKKLKIDAVPFKDWQKAQNRIKQLEKRVKLLIEQKFIIDNERRRLEQQAITIQDETLRRVTSQNDDRVNAAMKIARGVKELLVLYEDDLVKKA